MKRSETKAILDHVIKAVPQGIDEAGMTTNACILASRLTVEMLRAKGVRARPLPVKLRVFNAIYVDYVLRYGSDELPVEAREQAVKDGAWGVVVGFGSDKNDGWGWDGHVVVIAEERYLVDPTAHQVKRLKHSIDAEPFWTESRELARGESASFVNHEDDCVWFYEPDPENKGYLSTPAWSGYRVSVRGGYVISERVGPRPDVPVAEEVKAAL
jgi:hypothetical protein